MPTRILVIDDDASTQTLLRTGLEKAGFTTMIAYSVNDALMKMKIRIPHLIISDVNMPDLDGIDLLMRLRAHDDTKYIPLIIMTSSGHLEENFKKIGIHHFLKKPFQLDDLIEKINNVMADRPDSFSQVD